MAYTIYKADGTAVSVVDNAVDTDYYDSSGGTTGSGLGIQLVGRNTINYGEPIAQNILQMTENFASGAGYFPNDSIALQGQLWFNKQSTTAGALYVRIVAPTPGVPVHGGLANWQKIVTVSNTETGTPTDGDTWIHFTDLINHPPDPASLVISMYAGGAWRQIFPAVYS